MTMTPLSTDQYIIKLKNYANIKLSSWNPFNLFRNKKLNNHTVASEIANILEQPNLSDFDILKIAGAIDGFEDHELQQDLLCFLYGTLKNNSNSFVSRRKNVEQINSILVNLVQKKYRPWWALFLIERPYYPTTFRTSLDWCINRICQLFTTRREEKKAELLTNYSDDVMIDEIIQNYNHSDHQDGEQKSELNTILEISLNETTNHTTQLLYREIGRLLSLSQYGQLLISVGTFGLVTRSYLSKEENKHKTIAEQAKEILYILSKVALKHQARQLIKLVLPGVSEVTSAVVSVSSSNSSTNPLDTDRKISKAFASVAGGAMGGIIGGTLLPVVGTSIGAYAGAVLSKTVVARFYKSLQAWQVAPKGEESIVPDYIRSIFAVKDNDAKNILEPVYKRHLDTEKACKEIGSQMAKWLYLYSKLSQDSASTSNEYLEIIDEEMNRLESEFNKLRKSHTIDIQRLCKSKPDNPNRVNTYLQDVNECLETLYGPMKEMKDAYHLATKTHFESYAVISEGLSASPTAINRTSKQLASNEEHLVHLSLDDPSLSDDLSSEGLNRKESVHLTVSSR